MRAFFAVYPPPAVLTALTGTRVAFLDDAASRGWRVTDPAMLHVTTKFLGEVPADVVDAIAADVAPLALPAMRLGAEGLGTFPERGAPRVLWAGVTGDVEPLVGLAATLDEVAARHGVPAETRPFTPHWTLARVRRGARVERRAVQAWMAGEALHVDPAAVAELALMRSELDPRGARHARMRGFALNENEEGTT